MKVNVVGWYGMNNIGDEAFKPAINRIFQNHEVEYITPPKKHTSPDLVVLGGGAVASPFYFEVMPKGCPRYALGIDLAYESESDLLAKEQFNAVYFRNSLDMKYWKWKFDCPVQAIPDLSFYIRPSGRRVAEKFHVLKTDSKKVAVFATDYVNPAQGRPPAEFGAKSWSFATNLAKELDQMTADGWTVYILCCSTGGYGDDRRMGLQLKAFMKHPPVLILDTFSPQDMVDFIAEMDLSVCQRFHSHLFSTIAGTPFVSIEYTRKVRMYLEDLGLKDDLTCAAFKGEEFDTSKFQDVVAKVMERPNWRKRLRHIACQNYNRLTEAIATIRQDWLRERP